MPTQIQKFGSINGVKSTGKNYNLSDLIQESYRVFYEAKKLNNGTLIKFTESHLANLKKDPMNETLSKDLDVLQGLVRLGKDQKLKDVEEVNTQKKPRKRSINSCMKPTEPVKESSWSSNNKSINKSLRSFGESVRSKVFYKELDKFNKSISKKTPITMSEAVNLYKASNSCLTHLTVQLERDPSFKSAYKECTNILSRDNLKLLESIQNGKLPSRSLLESFVKFTNILLECDTPEKLDPDLYEDADMEELDDEDVINEDADMEELDDKDVLDEDADMEELDDEDVINEEEEIPDDISIEDPSEIQEEDVDSDVTVDFAPEELDILKRILSKITGGLQEEKEENIDLVPDETPVPELDEDEEDPSSDDSSDIEGIDEDEEDPSSDDSSDIEGIDEDDVESEGDDDSEEDVDEEEDEEDIRDRLVNVQEEVDSVIDDIDSLNEEEEDCEDCEDVDTDLTESAINRIKKSF